MPLWILLLFCSLSLGCNATCLRDSDCMGASVCTQNRCILVVRRDADAATTAPPSDIEDPATLAPDASGPGSDAGSVN